MSVLQLAAAAALGVLCSGCGSEAGIPCGPGSARVARVIDGDTIELEGGEKVRYLMVDSPEITGGHEECYGEEARALNEQLVGGKQVTLTYDEECTDRFGRLLSYVAINEREINTLLVERGYACVLYVPPSGAARREEFEALEFEARSLKRGLWNPETCEENPCGS